MIDFCGTVSVVPSLPVAPFWVEAEAAPVSTLTVSVVPFSVPVPPWVAVTVIATAQPPYLRGGG